MCNELWKLRSDRLRVRENSDHYRTLVGVPVPTEWNSAIAQTKKGSPYIGQVLDAGFSKAVATVVLLTPDDEARLKNEFFRRKSDPGYEAKLTGQPRPNVLFEAGMAFGHHPDNTVIVQVGKIRPISDLTGRHIVHLDDSVETRHQLIIKLKAARCPVDDTGTDWHAAGEFR